MKKRKMTTTTLVGVLKTKRDLDLLLKEHWYRIPIAHAPVKKFSYLAFYQPASFGKQGKCIRYYAKVVKREIYPRLNLLPDEKNHPQAKEKYYKLWVVSIRELAVPIKNTLPRRVTFGFTTLRQLRTAKNILELYGVPETEAMISEALREHDINLQPQFWISAKKESRHRRGRLPGRYCLDFAIFCKNGAIAIECDNKKAHSGKLQRRKDGTKDRFLRRRGWTVIRLRETTIIKNIDACVSKIEKTIHRLGGPIN